jgi:hypothetical protein
MVERSRVPDRRLLAAERCVSAPLWLFHSVLTVRNQQKWLMCVVKVALLRYNCLVKGFIAIEQSAAVGEFGLDPCTLAPAIPGARLPPSFMCVVQAWKSCASSETR